jgi:hypothetical protein
MRSLVSKHGRSTIENRRAPRTTGTPDLLMEISSSITKSRCFGAQRQAREKHGDKTRVKSMPIDKMVRSRVPMEFTMPANPDRYIQFSVRDGKKKL